MMPHGPRPGLTAPAVARPVERVVRHHCWSQAMSSLIFVLVAAIAAVVAIMAAHRAQRTCRDAASAARSAADALERAAARSSEAMRLASLAEARASLAILRVSSSRASRLAAAASSRSACFSASQADAARPTSSDCPPNRNLVPVSPCFSNTSRCGSGLGSPMQEPSEGVFVMPNVRAKLLATAGVVSPG